MGPGQGTRHRTPLLIDFPLVVGYKGEIGRFILAGLLEDMPKANDIFCVDINNSVEDVRERIRKSDFIFLCVPLQHTNSWLKEHLQDLKGKVIVEQCSIKSFLYEDPAYADLQFLSMHLLFRPSATPVSDRRCLVFSERIEASILEKFSEIMGRALKTSFQTIEGGSDPAHIEHDRMMARQQALAHRVILVLASKLQDRHAQTFIGQRLAELAARIQAGDPVLYRLIQENPFTAEEVEEFQRDLANFEIA